MNHQATRGHWSPAHRGKVLQEAWNFLEGFFRDTGPHCFRGRFAKNYAPLYIFDYIALSLNEV
ncbi:hypothetical protein DC20_22155 (plasmid) [Rufibacter tibetensis]|uniref:Uncharacterized protein n=1 Tax=Rufibacter tibetensis TaxID=512763 RepID=A0A0P0CVU8_9BACT|nr:hypothetical protein DC20_22155 [Rufibacter tibetensis]